MGKQETHKRNHKTALSLLRLQPVAHKYCNWSPHDREVTIQTVLQLNLLRVRPAATIIAGGRLTDCEENGKKTQ